MFLYRAHETFWGGGLEMGSCDNADQRNAFDVHIDRCETTVGD